ncbi:MAG: arginine--tRNA ligase [Deltaproteobacteria bacterium]|nr:arginine--tRNA ligase [Deltaproteobacteria bacterium]
MKEILSRLLENTLHNCFLKGELIKGPIPEFVIEIPNNPDHGHFATNLPMNLASSQKRNPREIADIIVRNIEDGEGLMSDITIAGPGFINFIIRKDIWLDLLNTIVDMGDRYGSNNPNSNEKILFEFVSANPTGPLHLGHGRGAALGDTICRILTFRGYEVVREFYVNDAGIQVRLLGESIFSRWKQKSDPGYPFPENGYHGDYIVELANQISSEKDITGMEMEEAVLLCAEMGKNRMLKEIKRDLEQFRVSFDIWFNETDLYTSGRIEKSLEKIKEKGKIYEKDGAIWIETTAFGDDKDRVIKKQNGQFTYFSSDISYHLNKWERGFTRAVNIWGADHHGYVQRVKAAIMANDIEESWLSVLLVQLVKLWESGQEIKMSKRSGQYVTVRELIEEVGVDAVRFVFLTKSHDSQLDFDIDRVKRHDSENPVYYVQYAHARVCSIFRKAGLENISLPEEPARILHRLEMDEEIQLIRYMSEFPSLLEDICKTYEAHRLTYFLTELAAMFHRYFNLGNKNPEYRIITEDRTLCQARLCLAEATRTVINNGLKLLGIDSPDRM